MKIIPKKSLGQHFLNSKHVLAQIISAAKLQEGETVLEIGPGTGVLTESLLNSNVKVVAIEKDIRSYELLKERFSKEILEGKLNLIQADILEFSVSEVLNSSYAVIANIPYYITGAILEKFLEYGPRPNRMVLLVQKEVAERIVSRDDKESILSISVKAFGTPKIIAKVPPGAFTPPPTVESAILSIENISDELFIKNKIQIAEFFKIVKAGFAHKRKFLQSNLKSIIEPGILENSWAKTDLNEKIRAEEMSLPQWMELIKSISNNS